jgi:hypothetical protein
VSFKLIPSFCPYITYFADYAVVIIMAVFIYAALSWVVSARKWFKGPVPNLTRESSLEKEL